MGHGASYYWKGKTPAAQFISSIPFGLVAQEQNAWIYHGGGQALCDEVYATMGCKFFSGGNSGTQMGGWYNREINSIADYKGLKLRMPGLGGEIVRAAGGTVVNIPGGELLTSLQSGAIDALEWVGPYNDLAFGFHKAAKYYYYPGWHEPNAILDCFINLKAWGELPADLQEIVTIACQAATLNMTSEMAARSGSALARLRGEFKVDVRPFPPAVLKELKTLSQKVIGDIAAGDALSQKLLASLEKFKKEQMDYTDIAEKAMLEARAL
jgi:TRAP-type mannitol/chloroaromatic compound transport system substrate-binding protein